MMYLVLALCDMTRSGLQIHGCFLGVISLILDHLIVRLPGSDLVRWTVLFLLFLLEDLVDLSGL